MDWHDKDFQAHVCEIIGIDYKGLPLANHHKQRYMSLSLKNPSLQYPGPPAKRSNTFMTKPELPGKSEDTENALLGQYDREITAIEEKKAKYARLIKELTAEGKTLAKRRAAVAKAIGVVEG